MSEEGVPAIFASLSCAARGEARRREENEGVVDGDSAAVACRARIEEQILQNTGSDARSANCSAAFAAKGKVLEDAIFDESVTF